MQRKALLLYLRELRDLEFAYWTVKKLYDNEAEEFKKRYQKLTQTAARKKPIKAYGWTTGRKRSFKGCLMVSLMCLLILIAGVAGGKHIASKLLFQGMFIVGMLLFDGIAFGIYMCTENELRKQEAKIKEVENLKESWEERAAFWEKEKAKVASLLEANYDLNIIPSRYRNIASIYYIYDYMSTSNTSLEETQIYEQMENGIQRIVERLDYVINQNDQIIMQNRRLEATNQQIVQTNKQMLKQLEDIEGREYIAAQYAALSANYSEATAYFSLADYLN